MTLASIRQRVAKGESATVEFKRSTATLTRCGETLCAFLNGDGGTVFVGVTDNGTLSGQEVSDKTRREIAAMLDRFEPPAVVGVQLVDLPNGSGRKLVVFEAKAQGGRPAVHV